MATNQNGLDHLSTPIAVLAGSVIIAVSIYVSAGRIGTVPVAVKQGAAAAAGQNGGARPAAKAADIKAVKTSGDPIIGSASAPIEIAYWFDYQCPVCQRFEQSVMPQIKKDYIDTGKLRIVLKDLQFLGPDSQSIGLVARAVWELAPDKFAAWHKALFDNQGRENSGWATPDVIKQITTGALGADLAARVIANAQANKTAYQAELDADKAEGSQYGVSATPSFIIGNQLIVGLTSYQAMKTAIDSALSGK